jgi:hypothetical protein
VPGQLSGRALLADRSMPIIEMDTIDMQVAMVNVIGSVALEETAVAHVLNAEGEKIQNFLGLSESAAPSAQESTAEQLIEVNQLAMNVVSGMNDIQRILYGKFSTMVKCLVPMPQMCFNFKYSNVPAYGFNVVLTAPNFRPQTKLVPDSGVVCFDYVGPGLYDLELQDVDSGKYPSLSTGPYHLNVIDKQTIYVLDDNGDDITPSPDATAPPQGPSLSVDISYTCQDLPNGAPDASPPVLIPQP